MNQSQVAAVTPDVAENKKEDRMLAALTARPPSEIDEPFKNTTRKTVALSTVIRRSLSVVENPAIMFASAYMREGAPGIAFQTARSAAIQTTGKVLYIHASDRIPAFFRDAKNRIPVSLDDFANSGGRNAIPFVVLRDSGLVCAYFRGGPDGVKDENMIALMASVRKCFEFTVIGGDSLLTEGAAAAFPHLVDGTILVAEAERTRAPVARKMKRTVEEHGGKVLGAILNRRRYHIPKWIYRFLYGGFQ
jgi:protein-tyrosine kinase